MTRSEATPRFDLLVAGISGLASVALVLGTVAVEQIRVTHEIQLWAPERAQVGDRVPVRAIVLTDLDTADGPRLAEDPVEAELVIGEPGGGAPLQGAGFSSFEGQVGLAEPGADVVRAVVRRDGQVLASVERPIQSSSELTERLPVRSRLGDPLQTLALARTPALDEAVPELDVRVVGGVCVAEQPCTLLVWRGAHDITPRLSECTTLEVTATRAQGAVVEIDLVVHGAEARCSLVIPVPSGAADVEVGPASSEASVEGEEVPAIDTAPVPSEPPRELLVDLQIPLALATPWITVEADESSLRVSGEPPIGRDEVLVDLFLGERWIAARTLRRGERLQLDLEGVGRGLFRVQARADVGSSERAYQRAIAWPSFTLARAEVGAALGAEAHDWDAERLAWELARSDADLVEVPPLASGHAEDERRLAAVRTTMRWVAVGGVAMAVVLTLAAVMRRGLAAAKEARDVLVEAGEPTADDSAARWRSWLTVVAFVAAMGLAILLGAAFLVARPFFMG